MKDLYPILLWQPKIEDQDIRKKLVIEHTHFLAILGLSYDFYIFF